MTDRGPRWSIRQRILAPRVETEFATWLIMNRVKLIDAIQVALVMAGSSDKAAVAMARAIIEECCY